ncbi:host specificity protein J [Phenylobacterium sp.]|uniref:host specificity protein J n=1 Tax=Phenylobacterium sp. TaxID=1871053 RepID=UPI000C96B830|nr:phage tail protein [Phenylobacterium sp.]MAK83473.1 hypothetical protein [Phenylobacterium sp.]
MTESKYIQGSGGGKGGGGSSAPSVADDTLSSRQSARVVDLISEGEIEGIETDGTSDDAYLQNVYLDGTPVKNSDGSDNFQNVHVQFKVGTENQGAIRGFADAQKEFSVGVKAEKNSPVTRTITDTNVDSVRVTLSIPSLFRVQKDGDVLGTRVEIAILVQYRDVESNEPTDFSNVIIEGEPTVKIKGKTSGPYQRNFRIELDRPNPTDLVDIRLKRISDDDDAILDAKDNLVQHSSNTIFQSYTEIIENKFRYPNSAVVGLRVDASQFNSVPTRKYLIRGIKVKIPSIIVNEEETVTVDAQGNNIGGLKYEPNAIWSGEFQSAIWTSDPAWILYDLLINDRYGVGVPESTLDKYDFFAISKYCNELVPDGKGSSERRFSCNILINSRDEVYNVIQQMTAIFRGIAYYGVGTLQLLQDKPTDPQYLLGPSNVVDGIFEYQGTSQKARHTVVCVAWQSYDTLGDIEYEYVEDADAIAKYGIIKKDIKAIGCYSQGQAHRIGLWTLKSEQALTETCNFSVAIESGIILRPGMVVDIADPVKSGVRRSGRIKSATTTQITTDSNANLSADLATNKPKLSVLLPTGLVEQRKVSDDGITIVGDTAQINVKSAFSEAPAAGSVFLFQNNDVQSQQFRVVSVAEAGDGIYGVSAVAYNESIYAAVDEGDDLEPRTITVLTNPPNSPGGITGEEFLYEEGGTVHTGFDLSWQHDGIALNEFRIKYRIDDDNFTDITTQNPSITLRGLRAGKLQVRIRAASFIGKTSKPAKSSFALVGKSAPPGNVKNLSIEPINNKRATLRWDETVDLDVRVGGKVVIKHSNKTDGTATWPNSVTVKKVPGGSTEADIELIEGEVLVKFVDDAGNKSVQATSVLVDRPDTLGRLLVQARREDTDSPAFNGTRTGCFYDTGLTPNALTIDNAEKIDDVTDFDAIVSLDANSGVQVATSDEPSAEYQFENTLDLGAVFALDLSRHFVTRAYFPDETVDGRIGDVDTWADFNGSDADAVDAQLYMRSTKAAPANSSTYTDADFSGKKWRELINGTFVARAFQFKAELTSSDPGQNIAVEELGYEATFQRRQENSDGVIFSTTNGEEGGTAGTCPITFEKPFFVGTADLGGANAYLPSIGVTVQNLGNGERVNVSNVTSTGFSVDVLNSSGSNVTRKFSYTAVGYGRRK